MLPYEAVRSAAQPQRELLAFLESAYRAGAMTSGWNTANRTSSWCPAPPALEDLIAG